MLRQDIHHKLMGGKIDKMVITRFGTSFLKKNSIPVEKGQFCDLNHFGQIPPLQLIHIVSEQAKLTTTIRAINTNSITSL